MSSSSVRTSRISPGAEMPVRTCARTALSQRITRASHRASRPTSAVRSPADRRAVSAAISSSCLIGVGLIESERLLGAVRPVTKAIPDLALHVLVAAEQQTARWSPAMTTSTASGSGKAGQVIEIAVEAVRIVGVAIAQAARARWRLPQSPLHLLREALAAPAVELDIDHGDGADRVSGDYTAIQSAADRAVATLHQGRVPLGLEPLIQLLQPLGRADVDPEARRDVRRSPHRGHRGPQQRSQAAPACPARRSRTTAGRYRPIPLNVSRASPSASTRIATQSEIASGWCAGLSTRTR